MLITLLCLAHLPFDFKEMAFFFPSCSTLQSSPFPSEVIAHDQWTQLKPEHKSMFSGWIKGAFRGGKKETQESIEQKLNFILSTAPMWDRLVILGFEHYVLLCLCFPSSWMIIIIVK